MDSPVAPLTIVTTCAASPPASEDNAPLVATKPSILTTLFPSILSIGRRPRSLSTVSATSARSVSPTRSTAPSTPHFPDLPPRASGYAGVEQPGILRLNVVPRIVEHLDAWVILSLSATTKRFLDLRTSATFQNHLKAHGWDVRALVRRAKAEKDVKGRVWMFLARSAIERAGFLKRYDSLPKENDKTKRLTSKDKKAVEKFLRVLVDVVTEHDLHNFETLSLMAGTLQMGLVQFVGAIRVHDWKTRYRKTFVIAAFTNSQPRYSEARSDLQRLAETLDFEVRKPPASLVATRANFLYTYACMEDSTVKRTDLSSVNYDPPHFTASGGTPLPGLRQAIERYKQRMIMKGFYHKSGREKTSLHMAFESEGLSSSSSLPFKERDWITLTVNCTNGGQNDPWDMVGFVDVNTGVGKLRSSSGRINYNVWTTPWGITGQKVRDGKHLGYLVLHWA